MGRGGGEGGNREVVRSSNMDQVNFIFTCRRQYVFAMVSANSLYATEFKTPAS